MPEPQSLPERMVARANADGLPADHEIRVLAADLETIASDPTTSTPKLLGTWARTRKAWCAYSGESLI